MPSAREQKDFVTNPCWQHLCHAFEEMGRKEEYNLKASAREGNITAINVQAGKVEMLDIVKLRLLNFEKEMDPHTEDVALAAG